jgi:hypothetical protein
MRRLHDLRRNRVASEVALVSRVDEDDAVDSREPTASWVEGS